jgi:UDP-N-acetylglucosamine:LPS N-acetylglucosamine transferase
MDGRGSLMRSGGLKIALVASAGGHLAQLRRVASAWAGHTTFWITTTPVVYDALRKEGGVYVVGECNRQHLLNVALVLLRCARAVSKERPDVVISTGAAAGCIVCLLGKLLGAKVIWLDSITNVRRLSLSGRLVRPFADLFLVQWPELAERHRGIEYVGAVI